MARSRKKKTAAHWALMAGCVYEVIAVGTDQVPTITEIVKYVGRQRWGKVIAWTWCGYIAWHFLEPLEG